MDPLLTAIVLLGVAAGLAVVDIFIPSGGMLLIMAALAALGCILSAFRHGMHTGMLFLGLVLAAIPAFVLLFIKIWPHTPIGKRVILKAPNDSSTATGQDEELLALIGRVVTTDHALMPGGQIRTGARRYNAMAEAGFIESGQHVEVIAVRERLLVVRGTSKPITEISKSPPQLLPKNTASTAETKATPENLLELSASELGLDDWNEEAETN
ncbi:MAG: NfeD family protein [Planctomycetales bacterium]|nr:NfeD family protein [Planctomycetales bacterium]